MRIDVNLTVLGITKFIYLRAHLENPIYSNVNNNIISPSIHSPKKNWVYWFSASVRKMCLLQKWYFAILLTFYSSLLPLHFTSSSLSSAAYNDKLLEAFNLWLRRLHRFSKPFLFHLNLSWRANERPSRAHIALHCVTMMGWWLGKWAGGLRVREVDKMFEFHICVLTVAHCTISTHLDSFHDAIHHSTHPLPYHIHRTHISTSRAGSMSSSSSSQQLCENIKHITNEGCACEGLTTMWSHY